MFKIFYNLIRFHLSVAYFVAKTKTSVDRRKIEKKNFVQLSVLNDVVDQSRLDLKSFVFFLIQFKDIYIITYIRVVKVVLFFLAAKKSNEPMIS